MKPEDFKRWRKALHLSQKEAAHALGLKRRVVQYYEKGERDGDKVEIPLTVRLACFALTKGITDFHGPGPDGSQHIVAAKHHGGHGANANPRSADPGATVDSGAPLLDMTKSEVG